MKVGRLALFLPGTFLFSWTCWGVLLWAVPTGRVPVGAPRFLALVLLGGLGPALGAVLALRAGPADPSTADLMAALRRWRIASRWYAIAMGVPVLLAAASVGVGILVDAHFAASLHPRPLYLFIPLFLFMILGGGLEEIGWRGLLQPELDRRVGPGVAPLIVGVVWAAWHLPLFWLPGVGQHDMSFPLFGFGVIGGAGALAWLYRRTGSLLACVVFHASSNAVAELGFALPGRGSLAVLDAGLRLALGFGLLALARPRRTGRHGSLGESTEVP